jgi:hypothetical protein
MLKLKLEIEAESLEDVQTLLLTANKMCVEGEEYLDHRLNENSVMKGEISDTEADKKHWENEAGYKLSPNQIQFCKDAEECGHDISFDYSGRGMFGDTCPSVTIEDIGDITTTAKFKQDSMGLDIVVYAQH